MKFYSIYKYIILIILLITFYSLLNLKNLPQGNIKKYYYVTKVIDGDTIEINSGEKVRYIGIDAPELGKPWANDATNKNSSLVLNKNILLERDILYKDKYNRILGYVWVDNRLVNQELVKLGLATILIIPPNLKYQDILFNEQIMSKKLKFGIWSVTGNITK